ncbi:MAG: endonuclease/exonuclease/phosphatase family protein [Pseudonocardia sp.]|uniref:endonuclease/exonuclease/phosphatase family protein n=1 Tax=unclassified Pseudonocardia TaxID=2619320 RepID=UPI001ACD439F|nr:MULTISPECIES: endonuclease/exonuclease/phosphatase family protein [unclassified Pseudonocardia]MBN9107671.1 endonuclease/exonuclease/phosphatase family protein [Pseudonocardia sp.]
MTTTSPVTGSPADTRPPRRRWPRFAAAGALTAVAALTTLPDRLGGLDRWTPFAQIVAFRPYVVVAVGLLGLVALVATVFRRRTWPFAAGLLAVGVVGAGIVAPRLVADPPPPASAPMLNVLSFNVYEGRADPAALAAVIRAEQPDLVSLPEAGARYRDRIAALVGPGYHAQSSTRPGVADVHGVTVLVADRLGSVRTTVDTSMTIPALVVTGGTLGDLRFVAVHSRAPTPSRIAMWRTDLATLPTWCGATQPTVVAGDLNATFDHSVLRDATRGCGDAATQRGEGLTPTWGPRGGSVGPQIDHVLATSGIEADSVRFLSLPGSDHRAVLARLAVPTAQAGSTGAAAGAGTGAAVPSSTGNASTP